MRRGNKGFTLIELLVVIAIIAILAALLFPVISSAQQAAKRSACVSNMGQLGKAFASYTSDYGRIPPWISSVPPWVSSPGVTWDDALDKYVRNTSIYTCPNNRMNYGASPPVPYPPTIIVRSYAMAKNVNGMMIEQLPRPSATVLLLEKGAQPLGCASDAVAEWFTQTYGYNQDKPAKFYHQGGKVFAFCDGHAACFTYPDGPFNYNYSNFQMWSTSQYPNNPGGAGYCGYADSTRAGECGCLRGANIPH